MIYPQIIKPTLLLDPMRCKNNLLRMANKAALHGIALRPHFKTHQSKEIGHWFRALGTDRITVSSVGMAQYFASDGWKDITIAFPVNVRQITEMADLAERVHLGLLVADASVIEVLGKYLHHPVSVWIKIDVGTHRTGIAPDNHTEIDKIAERLGTFPLLHFAGFLAHAGHSYQGRSTTEVQRIYDHALATLMELKARYIAAYPDLMISLGDTPGASMVSHLGPVDELRPGNYVFYDLMQHEIGACRFDDIAVAMACPVVAVHPERKQWVIYGGAIHFSKDYLTLPDGRKCFGRMVNVDGESWTTANTGSNPFIISLSQEHGIVQCDDDHFHHRQPGDLTFWLPVHSCLTADAMGGYITTEGVAIDHYRQRLYR